MYDIKIVEIKKLYELLQKATDVNNFIDKDKKEQIPNIINKLIQETKKNKSSSEEDGNEEEEELQVSLKEFENFVNKYQKDVKDFCNNEFVRILINYDEAKVLKRFYDNINKIIRKNSESNKSNELTGILEDVKQQ